MNKYDLLEAMGGIREEYILDAADLKNDQSGQDSPLDNNHPGQPTQVQMNEQGTGQKKKGKIIRFRYWAATAAALLCLCLMLPLLKPLNLIDKSRGTQDSAKMLDSAETQDSADMQDSTESQDSAERTYDSDSGAKNSSIMTMGVGEAVEESEEEFAASAGGAAVRSLQEDKISEEQEMESIRSALSVADVSDSIRRTSEEKVLSFENSLASETGYNSLRFDHQVVTDSVDWLCFCVQAYTSAAEGFEQVTHFTFNKETGEAETLYSLFGDDEDYIPPISEYIVSQMRLRMKKDSDLQYWIDSEEDQDYDFSEISPDQDFYFNEDGDLVICFNEGEAAPLYMGTQEFIIPDKVLSNLTGS